MKQIRNIFFFVAIVALLACGGNYNPRLVEIDSLTLSEPVTALRQLDSLDGDGLSVRDRMYFRLLRIKARDKAYIEHKSDSGVTELLEYFESHDCAKLAEAYYYAGSVYRDLCDAPQAVAYFRKAIDALPGDDCSRMKSNAYFQCGNLYRQQLLKSQAVEMIRKSYRCDSIAGDTLLMADCLLQIGNIIGHDFCTDEVLDSVLRCYDRAYELACGIGNEKMKASACLNIAFAYANTGSDAKAQPYLLAIADYLKKNPADRLRFHYAELMARLLMKQENPDAALPYCLEMLASPSIYHRQTANEILHLVYFEKRDFAKAKHYLAEYRNVKDSVLLLSASENTAQANALYNYQLRERDNLTLKAESQKMHYMILVLVVLIIAAMLAFWIYRMKQNQQKRTLHQQIARLSQLERMQREQNEAVAVQQDLVRQRLLESEANVVLKQRIAKNKPLRDADIALLDETVNRICGGFKSTLYSAYNLSAQEYVVCLLLKFELSATDISRLVGRSAAAITLSRKRLYLKLFGQKGSANDLDTYIRGL